MGESIYVSVSSNPLSIQAAYDFVTDPAHGAVDVFIGAVRDHHEGQSVSGMTYDVHEALAENIFQEICEEAQQRWGDIKIYMSHYKGQLDIGGISVIIAVGSAHRAESFEVCRYIIEELKRRAPVWKQEHYEDGPSEWLPGHSLVDSKDDTACPPSLREGVRERVYDVCDNREIVNPHPNPPPQGEGVIRKIAGVVLAGGRSSRMGQDKALLDYNGQLLLDHMIGLLKQAGLHDIYVSGDFEGYRCIPDHAPHEGPAFAIYDVLKALEAYDGILFVPVDMPLLHTRALRILLSQESGAFFAGFPLPAYIAKPCPIKREKSVKALLKNLDVPSIFLPSEFEFCMANMNTPEEWDEARRA